jgi:hypothetical protein
MTIFDAHQSVPHLIIRTLRKKARGHQKIGPGGKY